RRYRLSKFQTAGVQAQTRFAPERARLPSHAAREYASQDSQNLAGPGLPPPRDPKISGKNSALPSNRKIPGGCEKSGLMLMSAAMDLHVTQIVDGTKGVHAMLPKA